MDAATPADADLVKALVAGHRAFLAFLLPRAEGRAAAEDILQSAFATAVEKSSTVRDPESGTDTSTSKPPPVRRLRPSSANLASSAMQAHAVQNNRHETAARRLRWQVRRRRQRMEAECGQLVGGHVVAGDAGLQSLGEQCTEEVSDVLPGMADVLAPVQERGKGAAMCVVRVVYVRQENGLQPGEHVAGPVAGGDELLEVRDDLLFVPSDQDGIDVGEVLVQRRAPDAGLLRETRHRDRRQAQLGGQCRGRLQDRAVHRAVVCIDGLAPNLRHRRSISNRKDLIETPCLDKQVTELS